MTLFVTGATGFLGYHIVQALIHDGHNVICLKRKDSRSPFSSDQERSITWINAEELNDNSKITTIAPDVLIHAAWGGVSAADRNNPTIQEENIKMSEAIMKRYPYKQIIMLGSQDEYGYINSTVSEEQAIAPLSEYAKAKATCASMLAAYCAPKGIEWQWIRIFSIYGPNQADNWVIPAVVSKCLRNEAEMDTTLGEQQYAYLYVKDFAAAICAIVGAKGKSGIYNLSSQTEISLKNLFLKIKELTSSTTVFNFGKIAYRENQSMLIKGSMEKFKKAFHWQEETSINQGLLKVIQYHKEKNNE